MRLSIIHPSRGRPEQSRITIKKWYDRANNPEDVFLIKVLDSDDPILSKYDVYSNTLVCENRSSVNAINNGAKIANGDILIVVSDDSDCSEGWDLKIKQALAGKSGVLKTFDGVQRYIVTLPIITMDYYLSKGYVYHPDYHHMFCDTHMTHVADLEGKLIIRNDIVFTHNHYSTGKSKKDSINIKNDSTWSQGEATYLRHCKNKFGLGNIDVLNLSPEAKQAGHINWLKKRLK